MNKTNVVMFDAPRNDYQIRSVRRSDSGDAYTVVGKKISKTGVLLQRWVEESATSADDAWERCRRIVKIKTRKHNYQELGVRHLPPEIVKHLEVPADMQVTPEEMVQILANARRERYVTFSNTSGIEEFFDVGIQYIGYMNDDKNMMRVYDKCGTSREVLIERFSVVELTEQCIEAGGPL